MAHCDNYSINCISGPTSGSHVHLFKWQAPHLQHLSGWNSTFPPTHMQGPQATAPLFTPLQPVLDAGRQGGCPQSAPSSRVHQTTAQLGFLFFLHSDWSVVFASLLGQVCFFPFALLIDQLGYFIVFHFSLTLEGGGRERIFSALASKTARAGPAQMVIPQQVQLSLAHARDFPSGTMTSRYM